MTATDIIVRGKDFPAEHHFSIRGESLVAKFDDEQHDLGSMGEWRVYRKRHGGRLEFKGVATVASDGFASTTALRAFTKRDVYDSDDNPYDAY
ncbi:MAG: hypothetical protein AB7I79_03215 [Rhizobiaceae bacterium]